MKTRIGTDIPHARHLLTQGELVALPTETVYGLAGNGLNPAAILQIYKVKNRPEFNPLILHVANVTQMQQYVCEIPANMQELIHAYMPGPLTLLLPKKEIVPDIVTAGSDRVAIRIPNHPLCLELLRQLDFPLAAPSANPSGYISPTTAAHVSAQLSGKIPYILDGGGCDIGLESTIVGLDIDGKPCVYRLGGLSIEKIQSILPDVKILSHKESKPETSGQLLSHYAPKIPLVLGNIKLLIEEYGVDKVGILAFQRKQKGIPAKFQQVLSPNGDLDKAAQQLFSAMRYLDSLPIRVILGEFVPDQGIGKAINDRLGRARFENKLLTDPNLLL